MMKRLLAITVSLLLVLSAAFALPASAAVEYDFTDDLLGMDPSADNWGKIADHSDVSTFDYWGESGHPESGLTGVLGHKTGDAYVIYRAPEGETYTDVKLDLQSHSSFLGGVNVYVYAHVKDAEADAFNQVTMTQEGEFVAAQANFGTLTIVGTLPENTDAVKITITGSYDHTLDNVYLATSGGAGTDPDDPDEPTGDFVDDLADLSQVKTNHNMVSQPRDGETGLSVVERDPNLESYLTYQFDGMAITGAVVGLQIKTFDQEATPDPYADPKDAAADAKVFARVASTNDWVEVACTAGEAVQLSSSGDGKYIQNGGTGAKHFTMDLTAGAFPADTVEVKIQLLNKSNWTLMLDKVTLTRAASTVEDNPPAVDPDTPVKTYNFTDEMTDLTKATSRSDNWQILDPDANTGLTVACKTDARLGKLNYQVEGGAIDDFAVTLQIADGFFNMNNHMQLQVRTAGSTEWVTIDAQATDSTFIKETTSADGLATYRFNTIVISPASPLPANVEEISVINAADVPWTVCVKSVAISHSGTRIIPASTTSGSGTGTGTGSGSGSGSGNGTTGQGGETVPSEGEQPILPAALLVAVLAAGVMLLSRKAIRTR